MNHEHDPHNPERHGQDPHEPKQPSDPSSPGSTPTFADPNSQGIQPRGWQYPEPDQPPLPGLEPIPQGMLVGFQGPVPPPQIIEEYNRISPKSGDRILEDAHDDIVHDREISKKSFEYAIWESKRRLNVAILLTCLSFAGIFVCLFLLDPPESLVGASLCGIGAITPIILALLNKNPDSQGSKNKESEPPSPDTQG